MRSNVRGLSGDGAGDGIEPGAAAGAALFWLVARRRPPVPLLVRTLVTVALLPGVALTWADLFPDGLAEPVWPIWRSLAPLLVPLWLVLLLAGLVVLARRQNPTGPATEATVAVRGPSPSASKGG